MKKLLLVPLLVLGLAHAADKKVSQIKTMQNLEDGMVTIHMGLMYNDGSQMQDGAVRIQKYAKYIEAFNIKEEQGSEFKAKEYATAASKSIVEFAAKIDEARKAGDKEQIVEQYRQLQNECINCHKLVRKW